MSRAVDLTDRITPALPRCRNPRHLGHLQAPARTARRAGGTLFALEERFPALLFAGHGHGAQVRYILTWHGTWPPPPDLLDALRRAGAHLEVTP